MNSVLAVKNKFEYRAHIMAKISERDRFILEAV